VDPKPKILVLPTSSLYGEMFTPEVDAQFRSLAEATFNAENRNLTSHELSQRIGGFDAVLTGWGSPEFSQEVLDAADKLQLIAHSAGSVRRLLPPAVFDREISVIHAAYAIAPSVAELTVLLILLSLRHVNKLDSFLKASVPWPCGGDHSVNMGHELSGNRVGVVGASNTGLCVIRKLRALHAEVWVYDPYLSSDQAAALDTSKSDLDQLFANCPIVTVHAPLTSDTLHMVGPRQLSLLQDDAIFVNTARAAIVDESALLAELKSGRIRGAMDVFEEEPLPLDSPFRQLENLIITPHIGGHSRQARQRQGLLVLDEIRRFFSGEPLQHQVTKDMLSTMA
jgi:phosphoglycerate dehydrogenase-like enzyme